MRAIAPAGSRCAAAPARGRVAAATLLMASLAAACAGPRAEPAPAAAGKGSIVAQRQTVRRAELTVTVDDPEAARGQVERIVSGAEGFVQGSTSMRDASVSLTCRVPAARLGEVMDAVAALGRETRRTVSSHDVTDQVGDLEARLRNDQALRDRLQTLVRRARSVEDVLAVEKELTRVQSEIEVLQGRLDRLKSEVEMSTLTVTLDRRRILGPLGYVGYGLWWAFSKLFVIR